MKILAFIILLGFSTGALAAPKKNQAEDQKLKSESAGVGQLTPDAYGPIRSLAYDIDDAASKILEELLRSEDKSASLREAMKEFSLNAHQFRLHVVEYRKKPWNMLPEIDRLREALKEVQKTIEAHKSLQKKGRELADYLDEAASLYTKDPKNYVLPDISNGKK